ncbi:LysR family transcriptional regulator [Svornostia abyssi]|uniref:LysR family transcriptional regulator n=1 Tax=Svornostia abyssi TaxID=2898438 RepID=A0ABY5PHE0_9ACTN|nr:LysR family transcriptional regulator [Parviterribacteraceae bacterium J379]
MELRQLRYLVAVAKQGHITRAADDVHVTQSALSQQIRRLEAELGIELLHRTPTGVSLTPAGVDLVRRAEVVLGEGAAAEAEVLAHRSVVRGLVRVAATAAAAPVVALALAGFHRERPDVRLVMRQASAVELPGLVSRGTVDVAVGDPRADDVGAAAGVVFAPRAAEPLVLLGATGGVEALRSTPVVLPEEGSALRDTIIAACEELGFGPLALLEASDPTTVLALVDQGLGCAVVPSSWREGGEPLPALSHTVLVLSAESGGTPASALLRERLLEV